MKSLCHVLLTVSIATPLYATNTTVLLQKQLDSIPAIAIKLKNAGKHFTTICDPNRIAKLETAARSNQQLGGELAHLTKRMNRLSYESTAVPKQIEKWHYESTASNNPAYIQKRSEYIDSLGSLMLLAINGLTRDCKAFLTKWGV